MEKTKVKKTQVRKSKDQRERDLKEQQQTVTRKVLTVQDGKENPLTGIGIYFIRTSTKRTLG